MLLHGFSTYRKNVIPASLAALPVLGLYGASLVVTSNMTESPELVTLTVTLAGLVIATVFAAPWFRMTLNMERGLDNWRAAMSSPPLQFGAMFSAAFLFWAGIQFGFRFLYGIPSVFILVWYGLFGFGVAEGEKSGPKAIGTSVRIGQGRRPVVATMASVLIALNLIGALPVGFGITPLTIALSIIGLTITTNISMSAGARLYQRLLDTEPSQPQGVLDEAS